MSVALFLDHHVPSAVAEGLRLRGVDVLTAAEAGAADWDDEQLLEHGLRLGRSIYTQDEDFLVLASRWLSASRDHAGIIYSHQISITIGEATSDLELIAKALEPEDLRNQVVFIPFQ